MATTIPSGSMQAIKKQSVFLAAATIKKPTNLTRLLGSLTGQAQAESELKQQSTPNLPGVLVKDLQSTAGDVVTVDSVDTLTGRPIMGDAIREGRGESITGSSMEMRIDLTSKVVSPPAKMAAKRTVHNYRGIAMAQLMGYFPRLLWERTLVHIAGARGSENDISWHLGLAGDEGFEDEMINPVLAPSYNRHLVIDGSSIVQGGAALASIDTADVWTLDAIDNIASYLDQLEYKLPPVKIPGDPAADDDPIRGVLYLDPAAHGTLITQTGANSIRAWQAAALQRAGLTGQGASVHPLFRGEVYLWRNILIRKMDHAISFAPGESVNIVTAANRYSGTETAVTVNSLGDDYRVSRGVLMGAQSFAVALGKNANGIEAQFQERTWDYGAKYEAMGEWMGGEQKLRFKFKTRDGKFEPTDLGALVIDAAVKVNAA